MTSPNRENSTRSVPNVVRLIVVFAGKDHDDAIGREVGELAPDVVPDVESLPEFASWLTD